MEDEDSQARSRLIQSQIPSKPVITGKPVILTLKPRTRIILPSAQGTSQLPVKSLSIKTPSLRNLPRADHPSGTSIQKSFLDRGAQQRLGPGPPNDLLGSNLIGSQPRPQIGWSNLGNSPHAVEEINSPAASVVQAPYHAPQTPLEILFSMKRPVTSAAADRGAPVKILAKESPVIGVAPGHFFGQNLEFDHKELDSSSLSVFDSDFAEKS